MKNGMTEEIRKAVEESEFVLIGIGEEFRAAQNGEAEEKNDRILAAYNRLAELIKGKTYFVVTQNEDELIFSSSLLEFFIAAPMAEGRKEAASEERWNSYLNWLTATLNHTLCILELGVGFEMPQLIRWPFEKTTLFHKKSVLIRVNEKLPQLSGDVAERGIPVKKNSVEWLLTYDCEGTNR